MTEPDDMKAAALIALRAAFNELLSDNTNLETAQSLVDDAFLTDIFELSWLHQFDVDRRNFRQKVRDLVETTAARKLAEHE